jgi:hypothetical protein
MGLATPTEGGAMGSVGALVLAAMNKRFRKVFGLGSNDLNHAHQCDGDFHSDRLHCIWSRIPRR